MPSPTPRKIKRKPVIPDIAPLVTAYCLNRSTRERSSVHENVLKTQLMYVLSEVGEPDGDEGEHRKMLLEKPIAFTTYKGEKGVKKTVFGIQRQQRKGSMSLNEERTHAYLVEHGLFQRCTFTQVVINEDAILAANFEGAISDEDLKTLYDEGKPSFAFYLVTEE